MFDLGDSLLFSLSASGQTRWLSFRKSIDALLNSSYMQNILRNGYFHYGLSRSKAAWILASLSHIDISSLNASKLISIAPPVIVAIPGLRKKRAILCGGRSPALIDKVSSICSTSGVNFKMESQQRFSIFAPKVIEIEAEDSQEIHSIASSLEMPYLSRSPAISIAQWAGSLQEYIESLNWLHDDSLNWPREDFDPNSLSFSRHPRGEETRLSRFIDPATSLWRYRLYHGGRYAEVDRDWGRYIIFASEGRQVVEYNATLQRVAIPSRGCLPLLFSRVLTLCSGIAPAIEIRNSSKHPDNSVLYDYYSMIPKTVFGIVSGKLGQKRGSVFEWT